MSPSGNLRLGWTGVASPGLATGPPTEPIRLSSGTFRRPRLPMRSHSAFTMISLLAKGKFDAFARTPDGPLGDHRPFWWRTWQGQGLRPPGSRWSMRVRSGLLLPAAIGLRTAPVAHYAPQVPMGPSPQMMAPAPQMMAAPQTAFSGYQSYYAAPAPPLAPAVAAPTLMRIRPRSADHSRLSGRGRAPVRLSIPAGAPSHRARGLLSFSPRLDPSREGKAGIPGVCRRGGVPRPTSGRVIPDAAQGTTVAKVVSVAGGSSLRSVAISKTAW